MIDSGGQSKILRSIADGKFGGDFTLTPDIEDIVTALTMPYYCLERVLVSGTIFAVSCLTLTRYGSGSLGYTMNRVWG